MTGLQASWLTCRNVQKELELLESGLLDAVDSADPFVSEVCTHLIAAGGKRLRPALVLLAAQFGYPDERRIRNLAVAMELLHIATLYHDDVVDQAKTRRRLTSVNARWGNLEAVFAGDYLLSKATFLFASAGDEVNLFVQEAISSLWKGQMTEIENVHNLDLDESKLFDIINKKTASLYELACRIGAFVSGASSCEVHVLAEFGRRVGIAFQLVDDVMDIVADQVLLGKSPGTDLREGVMTLPMLFTLRSKNVDSNRLRAILAQRELKDEELLEALTILRGNGSISYTMKRARSFIEQAKKLLDVLAMGPARQSLICLADLVVNRVALT